MDSFDSLDRVSVCWCFSQTRRQQREDNAKTTRFKLGNRKWARDFAIVSSAIGWLPLRICIVWFTNSDHVHGILLALTHSLATESPPSHSQVTPIESEILNTQIKCDCDVQFLMEYLWYGLEWQCMAWQYWNHHHLDNFNYTFRFLLENYKLLWFACKLAI